MKQKFLKFVKAQGALSWIAFFVMLALLIYKILYVY